MGKSHPIFHSELRNKARELLDEHLKLKAHTFITIGKATGLSPTWLAMFSHGKLKHTDVGRVETLYNYLSKMSLKV